MTSSETNLPTLSKIIFAARKSQFGLIIGTVKLIYNGVRLRVTVRISIGHYINQSNKHLFVSDQWSISKKKKKKKKKKIDNNR